MRFEWSYSEELYEERKTKKEREDNEQFSIDVHGIYRTSRWRKLLGWYRSIESHDKSTQMVLLYWQFTDAVMVRIGNGEEVPALGRGKLKSM